MVSPKKHKLSVADEEVICLLGLVSDEPDYKLTWVINDRVNTDFSKVDDIVVYSKKLDQEQSHSVFQYDDENSMLTYRLIMNRGENGYFIPSLKNIDYFLLIQGDVNAENIAELIGRLNLLDVVRMCVSIDQNKVRERERLLLW